MEAINVSKDDKISEVMFNRMGKDPIFGPHLPDTSKTVYTVFDVKRAVMSITKPHINGITKDRIKVSLAMYNNQVVDSEHSTCSLVIAVYFDINDSNFVQKADNEFGTVIQPSNKNVSWFLNNYALKDKGGKPCDAIIRSEGGIHIVLNVRKIFEYMTDASGHGYQFYNSTRIRKGRKININVAVVKHHDGNRFIIDNFVVTKTLATKSKFKIGELTSKELRYITPQLKEIVPQLKEAVNMMTITDARYRLLKHGDGESPRMNVMLVDKHSGTIISSAYLIICRHRFWMVDGIYEIYSRDVGSTPVMNLNNLASLPDKYQASIIINMMAEFTIQKFVQDTLTDPNVVASNTNFYNEHNYNTLGKFTEECLAYLFPEYQKYGIENNFIYDDDLVEGNIY